MTRGGALDPVRVQEKGLMINVNIPSSIRG